MTHQEIKAILKERIEVMALEGKYLVESSSRETWYLVDLRANNGAGKCDCPRYLKLELECRHIRDALTYVEENKRGCSSRRVAPDPKAKCEAVGSGSTPP